MNSIRVAMFFIGSGLTLGFTLIVYAHTTFSTKSMVNLIKDNGDREKETIVKRLDRIESKIDKLIYRE